jgi:cobalamin synthase
VAIADEMRAAAGAVFGLGAVARDLPREAQVGGLVFYPFAGAGVGILAAAVAALASPLGRLAAATAAVGALAGASGGRTVRSLARAGGSSAGVALATAVVAAKLWAVWRLPGGARAVALVLAAMLGRWAVVVQCYGGTSVSGATLPARLVGRARLREFGWASAVAFATTLAALDAVGLVVLLAATLTTVGIRIAAYRRAAGVRGPVLDVSLELVETMVLLVLAALARG